MSDAAETLPPLAARFEGMPGTMQGGYVAALAAGRRAGPIRVRIRRPLQAGDVLTRTRGASDWDLHRGDELVLRGSPTTMHVTPAAHLDPATAQAAMATELPFDLPFPNCVGCGGQPDSLGFSMRPLGHERRMVGVWTPDPSEVTPEGFVPREHVWTIVDCLTSWCVFVDPPRRGSGGAVTGNIAMDFHEDLRGGETYICQSWRERDDERSVICGGTIHTLDGTLVAVADQELIRIEGWGMQIPAEPLC